MNTNDIYKTLSDNMICGMIAHAQLYNAIEKNCDTESIKSSITIWNEWIESAKELYDILEIELINNDEGALAMRIKKCNSELKK